MEYIYKWDEVKNLSISTIRMFGKKIFDLTFIPPTSATKSFRVLEERLGGS